MKTKLSILSAVTATALLCAGYIYAETQNKMVIELKTDDFELAETDISILEVGESETIVTDSGKTIEILRTSDGIEIYLDGELMDTPQMGDFDEVHGHSGELHENITIECVVEGDEDRETECSNEMIIFSDDDVDLEALHADGEDHKIIMKRVHKECISDVEGECEGHKVWISKGDDADFGELHEATEGHKIIRIHKMIDVDSETDSEAEKVIIIEKD